MNHMKLRRYPDIPGRCRDCARQRLSRGSDVLCISAGSGPEDTLEMPILAIGRRLKPSQEVETREQEETLKLIRSTSPLIHPFKTTVPLFIHAGAAEAFCQSITTFTE